MTKKFIATVLAASIAMASLSAIPAAAKPNDGVRILQGLAALYIVSRVIKDNKSHRQTTVAPTRRHRTPVATHRGSHRNHKSDRARHQRNTVTLPNRCKRQAAGRGHGTVYDANCLRRHSQNRNQNHNHGHNQTHGHHVARR